MHDESVVECQKGGRHCATVLGEEILVKHDSRGEFHYCRWKNQKFVALLMMMTACLISLNVDHDSLVSYLRHHLMMVIDQCQH